MEKERLARFMTIPLILFLDVVSIGFSIYLVSIAMNLSTVIIAAIFILLSVIAAFFNTLAAFSYYDSYFYEKELKKSKVLERKLHKFFTVAIVIPVYNENPKIVENTIKRLKKIEYPKDKLRYYLVDDSTKPEIVEGIKKVAEDTGVMLIHRNNREGFKAGALNNFMKYSNEEMIAIFDADEYLVNKRFLLELLPYFENSKIGYVQTEKRYANSNFFANSINLFNSFFFSFVQPSRASHNTSIFAGSCGIVRRKALDEISGFPEYIIEDTFFSFEAKMKNYKGVYVPKTYALGRPMNKFTSFARQQWRYNYGGTQFLGYYMKKSRQRKFKISEHVDYISLGFGLNYLSVVLILFTILSILIVFSNFPFARQSLSDLINPLYFKFYLEVYGILALLLSFLAPIIVSRIYFKSFRYGIMIFLLNFALAIIRTKAAIAALLHANPTTKWIKGGSSANNRFATALRNSITEMAFSASLFGLGIFAFVANNFSGGVWLVWYSILYSSTFYFFYKYG
ncbi:MAG: glycosyltransferase [Candidatus Micrarchaeia archaeon]